MPSFASHDGPADAAAATAAAASAAAAAAANPAAALAVAPLAIITSDAGKQGYACKGVAALEVLLAFCSCTLLLLQILPVEDPAC